MAPRSVVIVAFILSAAGIPQICHGPTDSVLTSQARLTSPPTLERQKIDPDAPRTRHNPEYDLDIPFETVAFGLANIRSLQETGTTTLELPGVMPITLTMERVTYAVGITSMTLSANGLRSTLSHRGSNFYLSLATPQGGYRIEGDSQETRLIHNQTLNQRMITTDVDYRYAH